MPHIDKVQLLEAARLNLKRLQQETGKSMLREGNANGIASSMEKPAIPIRNFGKTVEEFTDYCKNLMENENTDNNSCSDNTLNDSAVAVSRHPSRKKARSAAAIVLNISNAMPSIEVPVRNQSHLKQRFPVSSGQQHLVLEWIPVTDCGKPPIGTELLSEEARTATGTPSPWLTKPTSLPLTQMGSSGNTNPLTGEATPEILNWSGEPQF